MCGRFAITETLIRLISRFNFDAEDFEYIKRYNIAPSQAVPIILFRDGKRKMEMLKWGLVPFWAKEPKIGNKMINVRAESVKTKPGFKKSVRRRRCLVPATGFFEWERKGKEKIPYYIYLENEEPFAMAGIWDRWEDSDGNELETFAIITCVPNGLVENLHDRMPVILLPEDEEQWLDPKIQDEKNVIHLLKPYPADKMTMHRVSTLVNSYMNDVPECVEKV